MSEALRCVELADAAATEALGRALAAVVSTPGVVFLSGELGAGKTTLTRALLDALGHRGAVRSPTYTLLEVYDLERLRCIHCDFYRIGDPGEIEYLGLFDLLGEDSLVLIEWPEHGAQGLLQPDLVIALDYAGDGRRARLRAETGAGRAWLRAIP